MPSLRKTKRYNKNKRRLKKSSNKSRKMRGGWGCNAQNTEIEELRRKLDNLKKRLEPPPLGPWVRGTPVVRIPYSQPEALRYYGQNNTNVSAGYD